MARLRIIAGPNGSGKSTLVRRIANDVNIGDLLNADTIQQAMRQSPLLDFFEYGLVVSQSEWSRFCTTHSMQALAVCLSGSRVSDNLLVFDQEPQSYDTAVIVDFLRKKLTAAGATFSLETVFSHQSKLKAIESANEAGYRTYLYFVATASPELCIQRVIQRAHTGGHDVPHEKIRKRYARALDQIIPAIRLTHRAYIFDNSKTMTLLAEVSPDKQLSLKVERVPEWFETNVLNRL